MLSKMINRDVNKFTVMITVLELLRGHILALENQSLFDGMSLTEIKIGYDKTARSLNKKQFYPTYLQRHTKNRIILLSFLQVNFLFGPNY